MCRSAEAAATFTIIVMIIIVIITLENGLLNAIQGMQFVIVTATVARLRARLLIIQTSSAVALNAHTIGIKCLFEGFYDIHDIFCL